MSEFIQLHLLTSYPPSNLNRDDLGRPKTAIMGGVNRLRISSQSLKRAWRTSGLFEQRISSNKIQVFGKDLPEGIGVRSKIFGPHWFMATLLNNGIEEKEAELWSKDITSAFGQVEKDKNELSQLAHLSEIELKGCSNFIEKLIKHLKGDQDQLILSVEELQKKREKKKKSDEIKKINENIAKKIRPEILNSGKTTVDIALFGRMLASSPSYNVEAGAQVAHAITVHPVKVDDDYFTAVDDLNEYEEDAGAAHIGEIAFGAGVFYLYVCINRDLLLENLQNDKDLTQKTLAALVETAARVSPTGKQNSFASRAYTSYMLAEKGSQQPRSLSVAFLKPVLGRDQLGDAVRALETQRSNFDKVYGKCYDGSKSFDAITGEGSLKEVIEFVSGRMTKDTTGE